MRNRGILVHLLLGPEGLHNRGIIVHLCCTYAWGLAIGVSWHLMLEHQIWRGSNNRGILVHLSPGGAQYSFCTRVFVDDARSWPCSECRLVDNSMGEYACDPFEPLGATDEDNTRPTKTTQDNTSRASRLVRWVARGLPQIPRNCCSMRAPPCAYLIDDLRLLGPARGRMYNRGVSVHSTSTCKAYHAQSGFPGAW